MPRLGKVLTTARGECPWWDHTITLLHCPARCSAPLTTHQPTSMRCPTSTSSHRVIRGTPTPSFPDHTPHWLPSLYLTHPNPINFPAFLLFLSLQLFHFLLLLSLPPTLCLCSCLVRRNEVVTHNQPRPTPCYIYIHSYYAPPPAM